MMRVRRLDLTRFGHFTDRSVDLGPAVPGGSDFHIIYGPNEAGKTTLMEAYLRLIYGFPMRDSYGFKHPLNMLQVGGLLEINQVGTELVRVKRSANSLLDQHGDAISETVLQACLGGIGQDDYRKLFCLDDATIEAGGEEITNSKGDIGRLLFAAAAGIGDLTGVLDQVAARAEAFHKRSASKTTFAGLRRDLDAVTGEIKAQDVSASLYHSLRLSLETAKAAEAAARAAKEAMERRKSQLAALIAAHPISVELRAAEEALAPLSHYPTTLDIDPEALVDLMTARVALEQTRGSQSDAIAKAQASRADLVLRPEIIALRDDVAALDELRGRMEGALADLPIRTDERAAALAELSAKLVEMGFESGADPTRFVLPEHHLRQLERSLETLRDAETLRGGAIREERAAQIAHKESAAQLAEAEAAVTVGPEVGDVLVRFGAAQCVDANRTALGRLELARATAAQKLRDLARGDAVFLALPLVPVTERQANTLATDILKVDQQIETLRTARATAEEKVAKAIARLGVLSAAADLVTDELAQAHRNERDARWTKHRATLDGTSADLFAEAMQRDDRATALRQAQTREIAEYHQARITASEAEAEQKLANDRLQDAIAARMELDAARACHLAAIQLPTDMSGPDLADWLGQHVTARSALDEVQAVQDATATARRLAEALRQALVVLPGLSDGGDLETLFRIAQEQMDTRKSQLANLQSKRDAYAKDVTALAARQAALREARADCDTAADLWQTEASTALPPDTPIGNLRDALPSLRSLREINETIIGLTRQITGMSRDRDAFIARIAPIAQVVGAPADQEPLTRYRTIRTALSEAEAAAAAWEKLTETIENAETAHARAITDLTMQDAQLRQLGGAFAPNIPTETLQDLRAAVAQGKVAIDLRGTIARLSTALFARLGVSTRAAAEEALAAQALDDAEAALASLAGETPRLSQAVEDKIEARIKAQAALDRVQGDADVARRVALQRTIEIEMQDGALRYLEDRFAHLLAERAIRRYRDAHRNGMLVATEAAFRTLTNGAYSDLSTQADGTSEALVAIQSTGGSAKQARDMSKGTKFQLYLALRAAAYEQVAAGGTILPFFCDDIFETFDESRTTAACGLMRQIGQRGQAIYLTHHKHVVDIARNLCGEDVRVHHLAG